MGQSQERLHYALDINNLNYGETGVNSQTAVVKIRRNPGERRSWAPKNCWRAFPGPTQPLMVRAG